jgi:hypothetical protein
LGLELIEVIGDEAVGVAVTRAVLRGEEAVVGVVQISFDLVVDADKSTAFACIQVPMYVMSATPQPVATLFIRYISFSLTAFAAISPTIGQLDTHHASIHC